jgi:hypothetical protein
MKQKAIPVDIRIKVKKMVSDFNMETFGEEDVCYEARFKGTHCFIHRSEYGRSGPVCRLTYTGDITGWEFAIFRWSTETYDPDAVLFPGSHLVDGTVEGALRACLKAYPV